MCTNKLQVYVLPLLKRGETTRCQQVTGANTSVTVAILQPMAEERHHYDHTDRTLRLTDRTQDCIDCSHVLQSLNFQSFRRVLFGLLKLGKLCNAIKSKSFIDADSDYECIMYGDFPLAINFSLIFEPGILFLKDVIGRRMEGKMDHEKRALEKLEDYVKEMGKYYIYCFLKSIILAYMCNRRCLRTGWQD